MPSRPFIPKPIKPSEKDPTPRKTKKTSKK